MWRNPFTPPMHPMHPSLRANTELSILTSRRRILTAIRPSLQKWSTSCLVWMNPQCGSLCIGSPWNLRDKRGNHCSKLPRSGLVGRTMCIFANERKPVSHIAVRRIHRFQVHIHYRKCFGIYCIIVRSTLLPIHACMPWVTIAFVRTTIETTRRTSC